MSNARNLALLEKWTDASTTGIPTISPTSPKATTFCCCPHRRRYNLKQSKKQKNHYNTSDFTYVVADDAKREQNNSSTSNIQRENNCCITPAEDIVSDTEILQSNLNKSEKLRQRTKSVQVDTANTKASNNTNNEYCKQFSNVAQKGEQQQKIAQSAGEQWLRHDKGCQQYNNSSSSSSQRRSSNNTSSNGGQHHSCSCSCEQQTTTTWTTAQQEEEEDDDGDDDEDVNRGEDATQTIPNNCENGQNFVVSTIATTPIVEHQETKSSLQQQQQQQHDYQCDRKLCEKQQQQQKQYLQQETIQRLSNNINNKENKISNSNSNKNNINSSLPKENADADDDNNCCHINKRACCCCTFCQQQKEKLQKAYDNDYDDIVDIVADNGNNIDEANKMTVTTTTTTTTTLSRKRSECGLTAAAAAAATTTTTAPTEKATTSPAITTPSVTTVIKTTMVKRSPNESTTAITSTTEAAKSTNQKGSSLQNENSSNIGISNSNNNNNRANIEHNKNSKCLESATPTSTAIVATMQQPTTVKSVKERIAAFAAGNDQIKNHDNNKIPRKNQCINNLNTNMTTANMSAAAAAAISTSKNSNICNQKRATSPISTASLSSLSSAASTSTGSSCSSTSSGTASPAPPSNQSNNICNNNNNNSNNNTSTDDILLLQKCHAMNDVDTTNAVNLRSAARANANSAFHASTVTNNTGSATMPRRRSPAAISNERMKYGSNSGAMTADKKFLSYAHKPSQQVGDKAIAATTPTTLAALDNLDLALSLDLNDEDGEDPYFALQEYLERVKHEINEVFEIHKARQRMQQQQLQQHEDHVDELARSPESDSGFDSASGHGNKLPIRATVTTNKVTEISAVNSSNDINGHAAAVGTKILNSSNKQLRLDVAAAKAAAAASENDDEQITPTTTNLQALPPPPLSPTTPTAATTTTSENYNNNNASSTLKRLRKQLQAKADAAVAVASSCSSAAAADEVNVWANKFLRDLDNLMGSDNQLSSSTSSSTPATATPTIATSPMLCSAAATAAINNRCNGKSEQRDQPGTNGLMMLRPEKHTTIPLQSFNLDCGGTTAATTAATARPNAATIAYLRTLSAPTPYHHQQQQQQQQQQHNDNRVSMANGNCKRSLATFNGVDQQQQQRQHHHSLANFEFATMHRCNEPTTTILKIEEAAAAAAAASATLSDDDGGHAKNNKIRPGSTSLADEELQRQRRQRQLENDMETIRNTLLSQNHQLAAMEVNSNNNNHKASCNKNTSTVATGNLLPKRERFNQPLTTAAATATTMSISPSSTLMTPSKTNGQTTATTTTTSYLLNGSDATKKGSTSTIWTSEESILRSVGAVDEDNNSTSSSACEEASGVLSSGKSGISLDSSGLDNDNNESGIGTATPPKDLPYWKNSHHHHHNNNDNESVSSLDALRKIKFQKGSSVASSDDPDLLEVLSLCDEPQGDEDVCTDVDGTENDHQSQQQQQKQQQQQQQQKQHDSNDALGEEDDPNADDDEVDEGHDEFELVTYCDCDYTDGDASSGSAGNNSRDVGGNGANSLGGPTTIAIIPLEANSVVLRRKFSAAPSIMVPCVAGGRAQKCRSHSLDTSSLPSSYQQHYHQLHPLHQHYHHQHYPSHLTRKLHHHLHPAAVRSKERVQLSLALRQEPFQSLLSPTHFHELPSPSSASLHSGHESLGIQELTTKSNSAPLLLKQEKKRDDFAAQNLTLRYSRSQSDRYLAEIEAVEACKWLRAAGFPQYAQMYEDHEFPIDLTNVAKDHTNLENDQLQSLYRRLCILNRCANMRLDQSHKAQTPQKEDSDDENFALSENWTFQPHIRRWSRIGEMGLEIPPAGKLNADKTESSSKESSPDRFEDDDAYDVSGAGLSLTLPGAGGGDSTDTTLNDSADATAVRLRRTGSERLKDGAKALLRRVESIKSRRRKRQNRDGIVISGPQALDLSQLGQRSSLRKPDVYSTPPSPSAVSPMHTFSKSPFFGNELKVPSNSENFLCPNRSSPKRTPTTPRSMRTSPLHFFSSPMPHLREGKSDDSSSYFSDSQESSTGGKLTTSLRKTSSKTRRFLQRTGKVDDIGAHSDSECHQGRKLLIKDANSNTTEVKVKKLTRGGSLNLGKDPKKREGSRSSSFRSRSTTRKDIKTTDDADNIKRTPIVRWHSFQMEERPHMIFRKCNSQKIDPDDDDKGIPFAAMSAGQLQIIRKLALVVLTGHMEHYCPTHRSGWNWELPKFIKKIKMPDYKDKKVFGVPLLLILQRTGQTLPIAVRSAFRWLQLNALDQTGLFRKSGVKSRIIKLKELIEYSESSAECMDVFDAQQAYDVADMLKQYFRDLPETLLTTKMSETFAAIFQHLPPDVRLDAVQCAVLLLPDENREILYALLEFLTLVADKSQFNQMTANNLAVCLAPSLFHNSISTGSASVSASPRRRKGAGIPDVKELSEAKASHECLAFMIENYREIFTATKEKINRCNFGYMEESKPVLLEALGEGMQFHNWRGYLYECTSATIKEGREKTRGWFTITSMSDPSVEIAYKKVGDGHPLRLWRCITEMEGPPKDVLEYIIRQRATWDINLLRSETVNELDERTEIFQYAVDGQMTTDFCVLRSWQTDLPRGACVIVETSIEHGKAKLIRGSVRGVVLASRYLIEPCGSGRSRVMHLARVDIKGKTPEWYNKSYGHICSHYLSKIRNAFKNVADGPESKV